MKCIIFKENLNRSYDLNKYSNLVTVDCSNKENCIDMKYKKFKRRTMNKNIPQIMQSEEELNIIVSSENTIEENNPISSETNNMGTDTLSVSEETNTENTPNENDSLLGSTRNIIQTNDSESIILLDEDVSIEEDSSESGSVINLDNYQEKSKKRKSASNRCINYECTSGENLQEATLFCLNFYRVKIKISKIQEVCAECYEAALNYYEKLVTAMKMGEYLIDQEIPARDDYVEIIDSDEESNEQYKDKSTVYYDDDINDFILNNLTDVMNDVMNTYEFDDQIDYSVEKVKQRADVLAESFAEVDNFQKGLQKRLDLIRSSLYDTFKPETMALPSVEIDDANIPLQKLNILQKPTREAERRSNINVNKPTSYCELVDDIETVSSNSDAEIELVSTEKLPTPVLPPVGELVRPKPMLGEAYYAMKQSVFGAWGKCRLLEIIQNKEEMYRVQFDGKIKGMMTPRVVTGKQLAFTTTCPVRLEVGVRVIAVFSDDASSTKDSFFTGIIAEPLSVTNKFRYLVFFDDGYAQYVPHSKVLVVAESSKNVWEDVHPDSKLFIKKYVENYPERPMVKLQVGQVVKTERNGKWWVARVAKIEGSLVQMYFDADARLEWIYRGSARLGPLYLEMQAAMNRQEKGPHIPRINSLKKNSPYVEYTRSQQAEAENADDSVISTVDLDAETGADVPAVAPRAVARKSTNRPANTMPGSLRPPHIGAATTNGNMVSFLPTNIHQPQSKVVYFTPKSVVPPRPYIPHVCSLKCRDNVTLPLSALKGYNPLSKPLLCGWYRLMSKYKNKKEIRYRAPCSRMIRNMPELHKYLRLTQSDMSVDMFDFDFWVHCLAEFVLDKSFRSKRDMSNGVENVPIPCVNYVDNSLPDFTYYSTKREPMEGVNLNLNQEFLCGCDCEDDCADKQKCQCWQLTIRGARTLSKRVPDELIGYTYKRLLEVVTTGIYECNSRCKCAATCLNRVVQHPLQLKLQLFKTPNRGWGIRCLNDIPQGAFICIYAGSLLTDKMANEAGMNYGDEYLAELDYIEVVERQKYGYESDVTDIEDEGEDRKDDADEEYEMEEADDDDNIIEHERGNMRQRNDDREYICPVSSISDSPIRTRSRKRNSTETNKQKKKKDDYTAKSGSSENSDDTVTISDEEETLREPSRFDPSTETDMNDPYVSKFKTVRRMFGDDEVCYIIDAKNTGNIGRFLNHSCSPNVFVQNVFVDTHDLRFPWVAFFAMNYIRAGTELTWNYNYVVGSVPNKVIFCHCGISCCRGRLL